MRQGHMIRVNGKDMSWEENMTIQTLLDRCGFTFRMIAVWVNGTPYRKDDFTTVFVPDGAEVQVLHMISGG